VAECSEEAEFVGDTPDFFGNSMQTMSQTYNEPHDEEDRAITVVQLQPKSTSVSRSFAEG
jgi:hypothetical protein